jgi:cytochrome c
MSFIPTFTVPRVFLLVLVSLTLAACGGSETDSAESVPEEPTAEQLRIGFGPISEVTLGPIDAELVAVGEEAFTIKCSACHKLATRYVAPPLGDIVTRRSPEFIMNMMLNPEGMLEKHPEVKALLAEYLTPMANQQLTQDESRAILEYLRHAAETP